MYFTKKSSPWKRLRWLTFDESKARKVLGDVSTFNNHLVRFLTVSERHSAKDSLDIVHRVAVSKAAEPLDVVQDDNNALVNKSVAATAHLRKQGLLCGMVEKPRSADQPERKRKLNELDGLEGVRVLPEESEVASTRLVLNLFIPKKAHPTTELRQPGTYDGAPVFVEWKYTDSYRDPNSQRRISTVSRLLRAFADPEFHSLHCSGYLVDDKASRYGLVYPIQSLPCKVNNSQTRPESPKALPYVCTLYHRLQKPGDHPSPVAKVMCAIPLLETILQLHTAGWLHKEIRSDNVIFVSGRTRGPEDVTQLEAMIGQSFFLAGYAYARADLAPDLTVTMPVQDTTDVYRHPSTTGLQRATFRKTFDLFSAGCVLLEIGLWSDLLSILDTESVQYRTSSDSRIKTQPVLRIKQEVLLEMTMDVAQGPGFELKRKLERKMGSDYTEIVIRCLQADTTARSDARNYMIDYILELEKNMRDQLRRMASSTQLVR